MTARRAAPLAAYFSMEFGLHEEFHSYAGGLGVLAGDMLRSCADLRVPLVAVTLLAVMILTGWSRAELGTKAKELLVGAVFGGVAYALYQQATRMGKAQ